MNVIIGFSKSTKKWPIFSWLVRWFEDTEYSHTYIRFDHYGLDLVFEASGHSVKVVEFDQWKANHSIIKEFTLRTTAENKGKIVDFCIDQLGKEYGVFQIIGLVLAKIIKLKYNPFSNGVEHQICSEFVALVLQNYMGYDFEEDMDLISPKTVFNKLN